MTMPAEVRRHTFPRESGESRAREMAHWLRMLAALVEDLIPLRESALTYTNIPTHRRKHAKE